MADVKKEECASGAPTFAVPKELFESAAFDSRLYIVVEKFKIYFSFLTYSRS